MMAFPWDGLIRTPMPQPTAKSRPPAPRNATPGRIRELQQALRERGSMTSDELMHYLGWSRAVLYSVSREAPRVRNLGVKRVAAVVPYVKATIRIVDRSRRPRNVRMKTAKLIYATLEKHGALSFADLHARLGRNRNTVRNTIYRHPDIFEVVQSIDERPGHVRSSVFEYIEP